MKFVQSLYSKTDFVFWPSFIAFPLDEIGTLAIQIFDELQSRQTETVTKILFDDRLTQFLDEGSDLPTYLSFLKAVDDDHDRLMLELRRFGHGVVWPKRMQEKLESLDRKSVVTG